jgi:hypothetical protein
MRGKSGTKTGMGEGSFRTQADVRKIAREKNAIHARWRARAVFSESSGRDSRDVKSMLIRSAAIGRKI